MCGIVGYVGGRQAYPILIKGLTRLEYRGYDSAGVALINDSKELVIYKTKGKVKDLEAAAADKNVSGSTGIAHTRWATHGEPSDVNSHPHYSENHQLALIYNGIIEQVSLYPLVIGESLGLTTLETIIVVLLGAVVAGISGMILAVPAAALLKLLVPLFYQTLNARRRRKAMQAQSSTESGA